MDSDKTDIQSFRQINGQTDRQPDTQTNRMTYRHERNTQRRRQTDTDSVQTDTRQTDVGQTDRKTDGKLKTRTK